MSNDEKSLRLSVATVSDIFNAPEVNPFVARPTDTLGEAGIERLLQDLQLRPLRKLEDKTLIIALPSDQITADLQPRLATALQRYCQARIDDNRLQIRLSRQQHAFGLFLVTVISLAAMVLAYVLVTTVFKEASQVVQGLILATTSVFVWVIMWDPLEALLFEWAEPARENRAFEQIMRMQLEIEAEEA
jgi:hypothetical protein